MTRLVQAERKATVTQMTNLYPQQAQIPVLGLQSATLCGLLLPEPIHLQVWCVGHSKMF